MASYLKISKRTGRRRRLTRAQVQHECPHRVLEICTEKDGCYWIKCPWCELRGPHKHSAVLALLAWVVARADGHPRRKSKRK